MVFKESGKLLKRGMSFLLASALTFTMFPTKSISAYEESEPAVTEEI